MQKKNIYESGQDFNGLTFIKEVLPHQCPSGKKFRKGLIKCICGNFYEATMTSIIRGKSRSCGCVRKTQLIKRKTKHGLYYHPLYMTWAQCRQRCFNKEATGYKYWGGKGIIMSDEFLNLKNWIEYVELLPNYKNRERDNLTLDRISVEGNYERGNLRWATWTEQNNNRTNNVQKVIIQ